MKRFLITAIVSCAVAGFFIFKHQTSFEELMGRDSPYWSFVNTNEDKRRVKFYKSLYIKNFPRSNLVNSAEIYCASSDLVNLDSARQSKIEAKRSDRRGPAPSGQGEEEDRFGHVAASPNSLNLTGRSIHIPHVIHFIWVGPRDFPDASIKNLESWKAWHPGWKIILWTDRQRDLSVHGIEQTLIKEDEFPLVSEFVNKTDNYGEKSDLLRYEILYTQGGIYVDHDVFCYHSFQSLNDSVDFVTVLEKPHRDVGFDSSIVPAICLIGSRQGHPIMKAALENVAECWDRIEEEYADRPFLRVVNRTFRSFGEAVIKRIGQSGLKDLPLPSSFLFAEEIFTPSKVRALKKKKYIFGSHSWDISWMRGAASLPDETYQHLQQSFRQHFLAKTQLKSLEKKIWFLLPASFFLIFLVWRKRGIL